MQDYYEHDECIYTANDDISCQVSAVNYEPVEVEVTVPSDPGNVIHNVTMITTTNSADKVSSGAFTTIISLLVMLVY